MLGALTLAVAPLGASRVAASTDANSILPQIGDTLVYLTGGTKDEVIDPADIKVGEPPKLAYPMDPKTKEVRNGSRLNLLLVARLPADDVEKDTESLAADEIVAYSAVCTHNGCVISDINETEHEFVCNCHGSTFDAGNRGAIVEGPATRRLAILPLKEGAGELTVAADFIGRLGPPR
ncbi:QcrA and Rieske domain-containing protein [Methyloligella solikamskensis]|uniref:Ubiquinol-cytochrome c reductase iron-sulfur subunit n=1 Tax=Methyloligella solikamskensis TaxID=1177756 RepID=A0ABW3JBV0_9HYPH